MAGFRFMETSHLFLLFFYAKLILPHFKRYTLPFQTLYFPKYKLIPFKHDLLLRKQPSIKWIFPLSRKLFPYNDNKELLLQAQIPQKHLRRIVHNKLIGKSYFLKQGI